MELSKSNLNNELKGYFLDKKRLLNAVKHFAKGVKKTGNNVCWQKSQNDKKIQLDSTFVNEENEDLQSMNIEEMVKQNENIVTDIYILLTPTAKDDCIWEFDDCGNNKYYAMKDMNFFMKYKTNQIKLGGNEKMKLKIRTENLYVNGVMKKEYTILEMIEILPERDLFS